MKEINGMFVNVDTVMCKNVEYIPNETETKEMIGSVTGYLRKYYENNLSNGIGIKKMFDKDGLFWKAKGWIISAMEKIPGYNGNYQIVIEKEMKRRIEEDRVHDFMKYLNKIPGDPNYKDLIKYILGDVIEREIKYVDDDLLCKLRLKGYEKNNSVECCHNGRRITKVILDIGKKAGFSNHIDLREVKKDDRVITKDYGWNYHFARLCDNISPIAVKENVIISVHPLDYYGIANGDNWSTCYTIDKNSEMKYGYGGAHCNAVQSHMLDSSSIVVYSQIMSDDKHPELLPKHRCCLFYLGEDKIIQGRVYPDGREDYFDSSKELREIVQSIVAKMFDIPNYWKNIKGNEICDKMIDANTIVYPDWLYYRDCNVSFAKRIDSYVNENKIKIGVDPICPESGDINTEEDEIFSYDYIWVECEVCGELFRKSEMNETDDYCNVCDNCYEEITKYDDSDEAYCYHSGDAWDV